MQLEWKVSQELRWDFLQNWELWDNKSRNDSPLMISQRSGSLHNAERLGIGNWKFLLMGFGSI